MKKKHGMSRGSIYVCLNCLKEKIRKRIFQKYCCQTCQMEFEYKNGLRDRFKTTEAAHKANKARAIKKFKTNPTRCITKRGYWNIQVPGRGRMKEHHWIWEKNYGKLPEGFVIHHINRNPLDNKIENLQMMPMKEHHKLHDRLRKRDKLGRYT